MPARVSSARFVGRQPELAELVALLETASDERAHMAFVTGESGMGKTRLVNELAEHAKSTGARVLSGDCVELGESELPYAPIVSALRPLARRNDPVLDTLDSGREQLAQLLPELGGATAPSSDPSAQALLFEVLLAVFDRLGRDQPVLLIIEDIHWADRSTRDFLVFLSRVLCRERLLVVATYRSDELHRRHPLRPVVTELERSERARRIPLQPFTRAELASQLADILGRTPDETLLDRLLARSEGNPLYAEELIAAGGDGSAELPSTLRDALMVRVEALSDQAQELLRVVAAGRRLDHDVLRDASGLDGRELRDALREAIGQRLLEPDEDGRYAFRHALLREAVVDDLLPGERSDLHEALATALERRGLGDLEVLTEAAYHWHVAGCPSRALAASILAADAAERVHAMGEAADQLERALELWGRVENADALAGSDHVDLLRRAGLAHHISGDHLRSSTLLKQALSEIDRTADPRRAAVILERLGKARWDLGKGEEAVATYDEALTLLPPDEPSAERAIVLAAVAGALMLSSRYDEAAERAREALAASREVGHRQSEDWALNTLGVCLFHTGDPEGGEQALRASMAMAREDGRIDDLARGYVNLSEALFLEGRPEEGRRLAHEGFGEMEWSRGCTWLSLQLAEYDFHVGDWTAAEEHANPEGRRMLGTAMIQRQIRMGELALGRGDVDEAVRLLEDARDRAKWSIEPQWHGPIAALLAQAYRRERRFDDARAAIDEGLARVPPGRTLAVGRLARIGSAGVATEADIAEHARALGRTEEADDAARRARKLLEITRAAASARRGEGTPMALGHVADAEAEVLRAEGTPDAAKYAAAAERWDSVDRVYTAALARRRQAEVLAAEGDREGAAAAAAKAREAADGIGAAWLVDDVDSLVRRARLPVLGAPPPEPEAAEDAPQSEGEELGLTPRERDVLALLAEGRTNREIGEALFMAEKTASVHVSRILAKLEVRSRTEAAAVAHRLGLAA